MQANSRIAWTPTILSGIILAVFGALIFVVLTRPKLPDDSLLPLANILLGMMAAMATQVANDWLGSSSGATHETLSRFCIEFISYPTKSWSM